MTKYIALLRGINVGGKRKILMADLKNLFHDMGFKNISTYIQSGNVCFDSQDELSASHIEKMIKKGIQENFGFDVPVIVRNELELHNVLQSNPFTEVAAIENVHLTFLSEVPEKGKLDAILEFDSGSDTFTILQNNVFINCSGKYSDSKLTNAFFENRLKVRATTRNWKTVLKLSALIKAI